MGKVIGAAGLHVQVLGLARKRRDSQPAYMPHAAPSYSVLLHLDFLNPGPLPRGVSGARRKGTPAQKVDGTKI